MNELSKFLVESIMEDENPIKKTVVIYVGRFQPMHKGHYGTYQHLVKKFGKDNVYVGTSDKVERPKSPFNFKEKVKIMTTMFGIPKSKIHRVKNPYKPTEILKKFDEETTAFVTVVGEKDKNRLGGKYFQPYKGEPSVGYRDGGYVYVAPSSGGGISGTETRNGLSVGSDDQKKDFFKKRAYGKFNATIFKMITDKLDEGIEISKEMIEEWLINESSKMGSGQADDGPNFFFPNYDVFSKINVDRATRIGYEVVNMITNKELEDIYDHPIYPNGPVGAVTPFPAGILGTTTANNQVDIYSTDAYSKWFKHVTRSASMVGYELVKGLGINKDVKDKSLDSQKGDKQAQKEYEASLNENIVLPVEIGDTLLMGKFKNKKVVVKSIGKDEHGMPTINGKKVVTFRLMKEGFQVIFEDDREDEKYTHVGYGKYKLKGKEDGPTFKKDDSGKYTQIDGGDTSSKDNKPKQNIFKKDSSYNKNLSDKDPVKKQKNLKKGNLIKKIKLGVKKLNHQEKQYFGKLVKNQDEVKRSFVQKLKDKTKGTGKAIKDGLKHEAHLFKSASKTIGQLASGKTKFKDLEPEQKKELKSVGIKILVTGAFAASGGVSATASGIGKLAGMTMAELAPHVVVETILKGIGRAALFADENQEDEARLNKFAELLIEELQKTEITTEMLGNIVEKHNQSKQNSVNEIAGTAVKCEKCNHSWEIESDDDEKYLCHSCGWDSQKQEYDFDAFDSWQEKMGLNEEIDERGGKLTPAQRLKRKAALAGKKGQIARNRKRTMLRKKPLDKLKKIAYKQAYKQVYDEFKEKLFPDTPTSELSRIDTKLIHKNVLRKKKRILKRARLVFLPQLRDIEAKKFGGKLNISFNGSAETNEMSKSTLNKIEKYAEKQLSPEDIEFTKHFFDRLNDPRNGKEISDAELTGFFKRLSKFKKKFKEFLEKYKQIVVTDKRHDINIPFVKQANQIIAKTVMRKKNFTTSNPKLTFEGLDESTLKLRVPSDILKIQKGFKKNGKKLYVVGGAVRDAILGKSPKDFDLATDAKPDEVLKIAKDLGMKTVEVGKSFGVVVVGGHEIATFRKDIGKGRRPSSVDYTDIEGDVRRRDLTINALFYDIDRKEIVDLVGGIADLKKKNIRTVGKAEERFDEDPLRKLRALRFQARLGGNLDKELLDALQKDPSLKGVSFERVRDEVVKSIKSAKDTKKYMELNDKIGFTSLIFPNLKISKPYIKDNDYILFLASLFKKNSPSVLGKQLNKLTYSNDEKNNIVFLVSLQHFKPEEVVVFKKLQEKTSLSDDQILKFGKLIGKDMKKFVNFNLSVGGKDVPSDIKGPEIGLWIKNKEKKKFMNEIEQLISDIDDKLVEMFLPNTKTPQQLIKENINESKLLQEGGAYGHMSHPFDTDINLTFGQLKDIVNRALEGTLEYTREKTDGQALAISWRDGRLVAARNKGHLKNKGENALDIKGVSDKFQGRGGLSDAYNYAMKDLSNAIKSLSDKQRDKVFKQGACFMNLEVIYPTSVNVIPYGQALLVFHGTMEYNDEGVAIGENGEAARILAGMIKQVNKDVQDNYTIQGPPVVKLPKSQDLSKKRSKYSSQISKLQKEFGLKDTDGVANYHQAWWEQWVDKNSPSTLDNKTKMGLVKRWAFMDKKFRLDKKNITDEKTLEWAKKTDKDDQKKISKQNLMKFEQIFLGLGAEVLEFTSSALTVNPDSAVRDMKKRIDQTIKDVKKSGDPKKIEKLKLELGRLNSIGGAKKIVPNEGIVFLYQGNTFKLTGTFASVNQILGIFF